MEIAQEAMIGIIKQAVRSSRWDNENAPGSANIKEFIEYDGAVTQLNEILDDELKGLYQEIIDTIEFSLNDDWLPETMFELPLGEARIFLREIWQTIESEGLLSAGENIKLCYKNIRNSL